MNDILFERLKYIANDSYSIEALRQKLSDAAEELKPKEWDSDDLKLGQQYRAYLTAIKLIDKIFIDIKALKNINKKEIKFNKER